MPKHRRSAAYVTPRVLFYSHDGMGLGHFRRTLAVAEGLRRHVPDAARLLITALPLANAFELPESLEFVRLPGLDKRHLFAAAHTREAGAPSNVFDVRKRLIEAAFVGFAPHLVVVDHTPVGLAGELLPILQRPRSKPPHSQFVLGLRDITYGPERTLREWSRDQSLELMRDVYDLVLIYGSPQVFDPIAEYGLPAKIAKKTAFTGYLLRPERQRSATEIRRELGALESPLVIASAGSGADGEVLIVAFLEACRLGFLTTVKALVVVGPHMSHEVRNRLTEIAAEIPGVTLVPFRTDLESCFAAADVVVCMGGYNSVWEAVGAGKRPIVVPRHGAGGEQELRAERLATLDLATVVPLRDLSPETLAQAIHAELTRDFAPAVNVRFDGLDKAGKALAEILRRRLGGVEFLSAIDHAGVNTVKFQGALQNGKNNVESLVNDRTPLTKSRSCEFTSRANAAEVIICVHDAVDDVRRCLASFVAHTDAQHRLLLVDDASGPECREELERFAAANDSVTLLRHRERYGYTVSANWGLRHATADFVVLLNSDTIVTPEWLERLLECASSDPKIGIVGPLSNAAHFQSVPKRFANGTWRVNELPAGWTPGDMARMIASIALRTFPRVGVLNGFCFGITRAVIDAIGYFDEEAFPDGYGEEMDYCFRALSAGFELAVADHAYVYHAKGRSYPPDQQATLKKASRDAHLRMHDHNHIRAALDQTLNNPDLKAIRRAVTRKLKKNPSLAKL